MSGNANTHASVFRPGRLPSLSRLPEELGRGTRFCERCGRETTHILYRVPKKVIFFYLRDHAQNVHATCMECAGSVVLGGEERDRALDPAREPRSAK